ncbi:hypothetical protein PVK06_004567 [Gossypium arboreum]|uniref:Reverse transcriptase domain-containing protein n=1 Tax=Gossypium arboreum TaxID=29729 RepID=A0ABR0QST7_GOSAR|nr:hypothetical protein PVK06_004567 [Gossypium arboreum]
MVSWLRERDQGTRFVYNATVVKRHKHTIRVLMNDQDGFTAGFFKVAWRILGEDFVFAVQFLFASLSLLPVFNAAILALVPKCEHPMHVKDFIPISCCNNVYKCITKVLFNRLTLYLPDLISINQTVFIKGSSFLDNTLLAQRLIKEYGNADISLRVALKINLQKAFDSLS